MTVLLALLLAAAPTPIPQHTGACRWVRGRFNVWNGSGVRRIWVIGTHRLIALRDSEESLPQIDRYIDRATGMMMKADGLFGDFYVCAIEPSRPGHMQHVRILGTRRLTFHGRPFDAGAAPLAR